MSLIDVYSMLGVTEPNVKIIHDMVTKQVLVRLKSYGLSVKTVPNEVDYIVDIVTIERFNQRGAEGMSAESSGDHTSTYVNGDIARFKDELEGYAKTHIDDDEPSAGGTSHSGWRIYI